MVYAVAKFSYQAAQKLIWDARSFACKYSVILRPSCPTSPDPMALVQGCYCAFNATLGLMAYNNATSTCIPYNNCTQGSFSYY